MSYAPYKESTWELSSKKELISRLDIFNRRLVDIYNVDSSHYLIQDAKILHSANGIHYFQDRNKLIIGVPESSISNKVERMGNDNVFGFFIGNIEVELMIK